MSPSPGPAPQVQRPLCRLCLEHEARSAGVTAIVAKNEQMHRARELRKRNKERPPPSLADLWDKKIGGTVLIPVAIMVPERGGVCKSSNGSGRRRGMQEAMMASERGGVAAAGATRQAVGRSGM